MRDNMVIIDNKDGDGKTFDDLAQPFLNPPESLFALFVPDDFPLQEFDFFLQIFIFGLAGHLEETSKNSSKRLYKFDLSKHGLPNKFEFRISVQVQAGAASVPTIPPGAEDKKPAGTEADPTWPLKPETFIN
jgi:hypothetical protein